MTGLALHEIGRIFTLRRGTEDSEIIAAAVWAVDGLRDDWRRGERNGVHAVNLAHRYAERNG